MENLRELFMLPGFLDEGKYFGLILLLYNYALYFLHGHSNSSLFYVTQDKNVYLFHFDHAYTKTQSQ